MKIPLFKVRMNPEAGQLSSDVLKSGWIGQGSVVDDFESKLGQFIGNDLVNTVNSATSGIHLALHSIKSKDRNEVLTTSLTCLATNAPILTNGLIPKWVDMDRDTLNMDLENLRSKLSSKTLCILIVHWSGHPIDLNALSKIQDEHEIKYGFRPTVIEDCAHSFGSSYHGKKLGNHKNICIYSFQAIKHLTTGDGGVIVSPDKIHYDRIKSLRWYGLNRNEDRLHQDVSEIGFKFHMNDINASIGIGNIQNIEKDIRKHQINGFHLSCFCIVKGLKKQIRLKDTTSAYWFFTMLVENRSEFLRHMTSKGIECKQVHSRCDTRSCFSDFKSSLPNTEWIDQRIVQIPCGWWVDDKDINYITDSISEGW